MKVIKKPKNSFKQSHNLNVDLFEQPEVYVSSYKKLPEINEKLIMDYFDIINNDLSHYSSTDDICTPMACVKRMIDFIPNEFWKNKDIKILDPCAGNGNFGAYCLLKTNEKNIWFNEINDKRFINCKTVINPSNMLKKDALLLEKDGRRGWDLIVGNPPYSGGSNKNKSMSNLFIEKSIDLLDDNGYLCFITPNNWMTYNNKNTTLKRLLTEGSFLIIDNTAKQFFPKVGSSFTIFVWQKNFFKNKTKVFNNYLIKDIKEDIEFDKDLNFIPLYVSRETLSISKKCIGKGRNYFDYRCDLHNFTQKSKLNDAKVEPFIFETIHTARKTRYATFKQDIYNKFSIIVPLSTYYIPFIKTNVNVTQSVGYISAETLDDAKRILNEISKPHFKLIVHLTRYGNFNNIKVLRHLAFEDKITFTEKEQIEIDRLVSKIKY